ncbi:hypothetical protein QUA40_07065 [Microcoleus sp. Pol11C3]|uniref:hypothetical protein n=1 Tax=Microcoleus sp. Pol11C3 TaxID=3055390 RepID=UPI002FD74A84
MVGRAVFFLESLPIPETVLQLCKLAAIEGFAHAVRHARKNVSLETPKIELAIAVFNTESGCHRSVIIAEKIEQK